VCGWVWVWVWVWVCVSNVYLTKGEVEYFVESEERRHIRVFSGEDLLADAEASEAFLSAYSVDCDLLLHGGGRESSCPH
jgi:hypothetical protein